MSTGQLNIYLTLFSIKRDRIESDAFLSDCSIWKYIFLSCMELLYTPSEVHGRRFLLLFNSSSDIFHSLTVSGKSPIWKLLIHKFLLRVVKFLGFGSSEESIFNQQLRHFPQCLYPDC